GGFPSPSFRDAAGRRCRHGAVRLAPSSRGAAVRGVDPRSQCLKIDTPKKRAGPEGARLSHVTRTRLQAGLEERRAALAAAHAHRDDAVLLLAAGELVAERADQARARHAERMPDGDRTTVRVELRGVETELLADVDDLR